MLFPPSCIHIYAPELQADLKNLDMGEVAEFISDMFPRMKVDVRENFMRFFIPHPDEIAREIAKIRILNAERREFVTSPFPAEVEYEIRFLNGESKGMGGIYDGIKMSEIYRNLIPDDERSMEHCHIIFTSRLLATWDKKDARYHLRVSIYSIPCIISLPGVVEAPARTRGYYMALRQGIPAEILKNIYRGGYIDYGDTRMTEVIKGYVLQAIVFHSTGDAFCGDRNCRLFNAHWQEEMIHAQMGGGYEVCSHHKKVIDEINDFLEGKNGW